MKKLIIPASVLTVMQNTALVATGTATGPSALALAAVIAQHSPACFREANDRAPVPRRHQIRLHPQHKNSRRCGFRHRNVPKSCNIFAPVCA